MGCGSKIKGAFGIGGATESFQAAERQTGRGEQKLREYTEKAVAGLAPYTEIGTEALGLYEDIILGGDMTRFQASPGYQFRLEEGTKALEQGAAARGGLLSGIQQKSLAQYGQDLASEEFQNYLSQVGGLVDLGYGAAGAQGGYYTGVGSQLGAMYEGLGRTHAQLKTEQSMRRAAIAAAAAGAASTMATGGRK